MKDINLIYEECFTVIWQYFYKTFSLPPKIVLIASVNGNSGGYLFNQRGMSFYNNGNLKITDIYVNITNKTILWYCYQSTGHVGNQLDLQGITYRYSAIMLNE